MGPPVVCFYPLARRLYGYKIHACVDTVTELPVDSKAARPGLTGH